MFYTAALLRLLRKRETARFSRRACVGVALRHFNDRSAANACARLSLVAFVAMGVMVMRRMTESHPA